MRTQPSLHAQDNRNPLGAHLALPALLLLMLRVRKSSGFDGCKAGCMLHMEMHDSAAAVALILFDHADRQPFRKQKGLLRAEYTSSSQYSLTTDLVGSLISAELEDGPDTKWKRVDCSR